MRINHFARKKRQLKNLVSEYDSINNKNERSGLLDRIKDLVSELKIYFSRSELKKVLGSLAVIFGLSFSNTIDAQSFSPPVENPFGISGILNVSFATFADLDNDGDLDMLIGDYGYINNIDTALFQYYENTGTANAPAFATPEINPFNLAPNADYILPVFGDLDGDGDMDILAGKNNGGFSFFENTGSTNLPNFEAPIQQPFNIAPPISNATVFPELADIDNDGDLDLFSEHILNQEIIMNL